MMKISRTHAILLAAACGLAGCGGGSGGVASLPPPPPTPTPTPTPAGAPAIIPAAATSQHFAVFGASHSFSGDQGPRLDASSQLQVRYVASSNSYEVQLPHSQTWAAISYLPAGGAAPINYQGETANLWLHPAYRYSRLVEWSDVAQTTFGYEALGMATPAGGVPVTGSASYSGELLGNTSEYQGNSGADDFPVDGSIQLLFDFGLGSLSGSISPNLHQGYPIDPINFSDTVYSTGSTTFSGKFDTNVAGVNSLSGQFTGPNAEELIGNFAFPYVSPIDSKTYQADGAFIAKQ
jgi:hypothetical protein